MGASHQRIRMLCKFHSPISENYGWSGNDRFIAPRWPVKGMETALYFVIIVLSALNLALIALASRNMMKTLDLLFTQLDSNVRTNLIEVVEELRSGEVGEIMQLDPIRQAIGQAIGQMFTPKEATPGTFEILERDSNGQFKKDTSLNTE